MGNIDDLPEESTEITVQGEKKVTLTLPSEFITTNTTFKDHVQEDLDHLNNSLKGIYAGWSQAKSIQSICKLATTTADLVERRRKLLCRPSNFNEYHNSQSGENKVYGYETLD